jgi:hypothetical protein
MYMDTKKYITMGIIIFSTLGAWLGSMMDHGNLFGMWGILLGGVGGLVGVWAGYTLGNNL